MNIAEKIRSIFDKSENYKGLFGIKIKTAKDEKNANKFAGIAMKVINKIQNTPYWKEYSEDSKEKMISKYFDNKIKTSQYMDIPYNKTEKQTFIKDVLKSVV